MARRPMAGHRSLEAGMVVRIHPGQLRARDLADETLRYVMRCPTPPFLRSLVVGGLLIPAFCGAPRVAAQTRPADPEVQIEATPRPGEVARAARDVQSLFERRRTRYLPLSLGAGGYGADETVGRFRTWYDEGEWYPVPEHEKIVEMRAELVARLDSLQALARDDDWILGQRVWYRAEGGDWVGALATARTCASRNGWWCAALEGFALHGLGEYPEALDAFEAGLALMPEERSRRWRIPRWPIDSNARDRLEALENEPAARDAYLDRLWALADPLYLAEGNDRLTEHYSRWTVSALRERARNPFHIAWAADLEQLTIRHGWEMGWERSTDRYRTSEDDVIGHKHPEGRDYMPSGSVLEDIGSAVQVDLRADKARPRSLYAPAYAPVLLPMNGQVAVFPRGERTVVVATYFLPADTTFHADHDHALPWMEAGSVADEVDRTGLFLMPLADGGRWGDPSSSPDPMPGHPSDGDAPAGTVPRSGADSGEGSVLHSDGGARTGPVSGVFGKTSSGSVDGALLLEVPTGAYVVSAESWSPRRRRAGRLRAVVQERRALEDLATLSDVLLLEPVEGEPGTLADAIGFALPRAILRPDQPFAIGWEVAGLGFRPESLRFEVSIERTDRSVMSRVGGFLGLSHGPRPLTLSWEEPGPRLPTHQFHYLDLDLPPLDEGRYRIRLTLVTVNRSNAVTEVEFEVHR
jgi:tetratricopeptide (TPR) repeat protein